MDVLKETFGTGAAQKSATMSESDLREATLDGVWHPECPYCGFPTPCEPDAQMVCCQDCSRRFKIDNPWF